MAPKVGLDPTYTALTAVVLQLNYFGMATKGRIDTTDLRQSKKAVLSN